MIFKVCLVITTVALAAIPAGCGGGDAGGEASVTSSGQSSLRSKPGDGAGGGEGRTAPQGHRGAEAEKGAEAENPGSPETSPAPVGPGTSRSGGGDKPQSSGGAWGNPQFVSQADAVCGEGRKELLRELGSYLKGQSSQADAQEALIEATQAVLIPGMEEQIEKIHALGPPPASARQVEDFLTSWQRVLESAASKSTPLAGPNTKDILGPLGVQARRAGLGKCAYG